jgi:hypothetical protein
MAEKKSWTDILTRLPEQYSLQKGSLKIFKTFANVKK